MRIKQTKPLTYILSNIDENDHKILHMIMLSVHEIDKRSVNELLLTTSALISWRFKGVGGSQDKHWPPPAPKKLNGSISKGRDISSANLNDVLRSTKIIRNHW